MAYVTNKMKAIRADIEWTMKYYGSDAEERENPGSKLRSQIDRIMDFIDQLEEFEKLLTCHPEFNLLEFEVHS